MQILTEPKNALTKQYKRLFEMENVEVEFRPDALVAVASGRVAKALESRPLLVRLQNRLSGAILVGLGVFVALAKRA